LPVTRTGDRVPAAPATVDRPAEPVTEDYNLVDPVLWPTLRRRWWLPVLLAILLGAGGFYLGHRRKPHFTATTKITIGTVDYRTQSVPGFVEAAQTLAGSYALTVRSPLVLGPLARTEHTTEKALAGSVTATAVPDSTVFSITVTQPSRAAAVKLVNAASDQARKTIESLNTTTHDANTALRLYRRYTSEAATDGQKLNALQHPKGTGAKPSLAAIATAQTNLDEAQTKASAYSVQYQDIVSGNTPQSEARLLSVLQPARTAHSDKRKFLERYIAFGIAAGLVLGILIALIIPRRRRKPVAPAEQ
jgi:capsular polysaccharide biosynthesis protein